MMNNNKGLGLVEVMVAIGILGVVVAGSATIIDQILQRLKYSEAKLGQLSLAQDVRAQVSKSQSCINSLKSKQFANGMTFSLDFSTNPSSPLIVTSGANLSSTYNVTVDQFTYDNASVVAAIPGGGNLYIGDLNLQVSTGTGSNKTSFKKTAASKLYLEVNNAGTITNCYGDMLSSNGNTPNPTMTCAALGGTMVNGACQLASSGPTAAQLCAQLGGTLTASGCSLPSSAPGPGSICGISFINRNGMTGGYPCSTPNLPGQACPAGYTSVSGITGIDSTTSDTTSMYMCVKN